jgi:hypothetical protein
MKRLFLLGLGLPLFLTAVSLPAVTPSVLGWHRGFTGHAGWGWGRGWRGGWRWGWGWPYYGPYYGYYGPYAPGYYPPAWAVIDTDVSPEEALVYLDGRYIGIADDFDGYPDYLYLKRGHYRLEFKLDGYESKTVEIDAKPGRKHDIDEKLRKIPGAKHYGSYETPTPEGGVQRFFGKRSGSAQAVPDSGRDTAPSYSAPNDRDRHVESPAEGEEPPEASPADPWRDRQEMRVSPTPQVKSESGAQPTKSRLRLHVEPADAAIYVDDHFVGTAEEVGSLERGVAVSPGKHTVTASRPGFKDRSVEVEVAAGESHPLELKLER